MIGRREVIVAGRLRRLREKLNRVWVAANID
jgi:hypothetical protein